MINNQIIKELAKSSIDNKGEISEKVTDYVLNKFNKKELKFYLRRLKKISKEQNVTVKYEGELPSNLKREIKEMYLGKNVNFVKEEKLGGGILIIDNDMVVDYTIIGMVDSRMKVI